MITLRSTTSVVPGTIDFFCSSTVMLQANRADVLAIAQASFKNPTLQPLGNLVRSLSLSTAVPIYIEHVEMISDACPFITALAGQMNNPALVNDGDLDSSLSYIEAIKQLKFPADVLGPVPMTDHVAFAFFNVMFRLFLRLTILDFPLYYLTFGCAACAFVCGLSA
ncbi:hypothetical protein DM01DRAFT_1375875 [Hesseltinella vesiculosa]|uniref:Uncharacterized protein n=1 Tax=Hesseltinella vesiculosa TaxID=101127 RepID=A0A1X2GCH3_9FUNG|nr:hypothetical protein DM01DRAFT_1375875 [Hesseltinella vesiculosa]